MPKDYYKALGVPRSATEADIKSAYRKLAVEHHPDKGGDSDRFNDIGEAWGVLGNAEKRKAYDFEQSNALVDDLSAVSDGLVDEYFSQFQTNTAY